MRVPKKGPHTMSERAPDEKGPSSRDAGRALRVPICLCLHRGPAERRVPCLPYLAGRVVPHLIVVACERPRERQVGRYILRHRQPGTRPWDGSDEDTEPRFLEKVQGQPA